MVTENSNLNILIQPIRESSRMVFLMEKCLFMKHLTTLMKEVLKMEKSKDMVF